MINIAVPVNVKTSNNKGEIIMIGLLVLAWIVIWYANQ
jgi:hypothetical protein